MPVITFVLMGLGRHDVDFGHLGVFQDIIIIIMLSWKVRKTWHVVSSER